MIHGLVSVRSPAPPIIALLGPNSRRRAKVSVKLEVLTPQNSQIIFIDHQPQMAFGVQSIDRQVLKTTS